LTLLLLFRSAAAAVQEAVKDIAGGFVQRRSYYVGLTGDKFNQIKITIDVQNVGNKDVAISRVLRSLYANIDSLTVIRKHIEKNVTMRSFVISQNKLVGRVTRSGNIFSRLLGNKTSLVSVSKRMLGGNNTTSIVVHGTKIIGTKINIENIRGTYSTETKMIKSIVGKHSNVVQVLTAQEIVEMIEQE